MKRRFLPYKATLNYYGLEWSGTLWKGLVG